MKKLVQEIRLRHSTMKQFYFLSRYSSIGIDIITLNKSAYVNLKNIYVIYTK